MKIKSELQIIPIGNEKLIYDYPSEIERIFNKSNFKIFAHNEGVNIEGDYDHIMRTVKYLITSLHNMGATNVFSLLKINSYIDKNELKEKSNFFF
jgi:uncharacterized protein YqgV (UPF0045/DUF77 family)